MSLRNPGALCALACLLVAAAMPSLARADTDACTLLTAAEVGAATATPVGAGTHVTPTFVKTCTWTASDSKAVRDVTLYLQTAAAYDGGKQMAAMMAGHGARVVPAVVGDDAYYFIAGDQVGLLVKKGGTSFKVTVYAELPVARKEAMELALARKVLARM